MRILLQHKTTLKYVEGTEAWTVDADDARAFTTGLEALLFCLNHNIRDMQILGKFADSRLDFTLHVTDLRTSRM